MTYRMRCGTTYLFTNVSCVWKTLRGPYGLWTKLSFTNVAHSAVSAGMSPRQVKRLYYHLSANIPIEELFLFSPSFFFPTFLIRFNISEEYVCGISVYLSRCDRVISLVPLKVRVAFGMF